MTKQRRFKQRVRDRTGKTGERYAALRRGLLGDFPGPGRHDDSEPSDRARPEEATGVTIALARALG